VGTRARDGLLWRGPSRTACEARNYPAGQPSRTAANGWCSAILPVLTALQRTAGSRPSRRRPWYRRDRPRDEAAPRHWRRWLASLVDL